MNRHLPTTVVACFLASLPTLSAVAQTDWATLRRRAAIRHEDEPRQVMAFYYPWYGNADAPGGSGKDVGWGAVDLENRVIDNTANFPRLGPYDSHQPEVIRRHCRWAKQADIDCLISSWWRHGHFTDQAMPRLLDICAETGLKLTIYYESVPPPTTAAAAAEDLLKVFRRYAGHDAWLRVDGKPVAFVYVRALGQIGLSGWAEAADRVDREYPGGAVLLGDQLSRSAARVFDGIHTYNTAGQLRGKKPAEIRTWAAAKYPDWVATAESLGRISTLTVIPGYDDTNIREPGLVIERFGGESYRTQWEAAVAARPDWVLITSFNEWYEGSDVEPSVEHDERYLKMTAEFARRFKAIPPRDVRPVEASPTAKLSTWQEERIRKLRGVKIGLLPDFESPAVGAMLDLGLDAEALTWEQVAGFTSESARKHPVVVYAGGEEYRHTVHEQGDAEAGLRRYLDGGGFLAVLPSGPMPLHFDRSHTTVNTTAALGLPLSVGGPGGGWEQPPDGVELRFVQTAGRLPSLPETLAFPAEGDRRWRPLVASRLDEGARLTPLLELRDGQDRSYGCAAGLVERPTGGTILYAWYRSLDGLEGEKLLVDLLAVIGEQR